MRKCHIGITFVAFALVGCVSEQDPGTPAERLQSATSQANAQIAQMKADGTVFTAEEVVEILRPVETAAQELFDELAEWQHSPPDLDTATTETQIMLQASTEMNALMGELGVAVPNLTLAGTAGEPVDIGELAEVFGSSQERPYWLWLACVAACSTAQVACHAACTLLIVPPLTPLSPSIVACNAACLTGGVVCRAACGNIENY